MTKTCWAKRLERAAWGGTLGLLVLVACACGTARAQDDQGNWTDYLDIHKTVVDPLMSAIGLQGPNEGQGIDYHDRPPLVVPPSRNLPPPQSSAAPNNPAWPVDPDQKKRRDSVATTAARKKAAKAAYDEDAGRNLTPSELNPAGMAAAKGTGTEATPGDDSVFSPSRLGYFGGIFSTKSLWPTKEEYGTFTKEPARTSLDEPPAGYQTPSAAQPYGFTTRTERKTDKYDPAVGNSSAPK